MSENEKQPTFEATPVDNEVTKTVDSNTTTGTEPKGKSLAKFYMMSVLAVVVVLVGVIYQLEREGRSSTTFFSSIIAEQEANKTVAKVNGKTITNQDLTASIEQFSQMAVAQGVDTSNPDVQAEIRTQALDVLINTELLRQAAEDRGISISNEDADARLEEIKVELGGEEVLQERMESLGIGEDKLHEDIKDELLIQALLEEIFAEADIQVTTEEIESVYDDAGGADAGLPALEEVSTQIEAQIKSSKEQETIDEYLGKIKEGATIDLIE